MHPKERTTLWDLTRGQRLRYAAAIAAMAVGILCLFGVPLASQAAIDGIRAEGEPGWLAAAARRVGAPGSGGMLWIAAALVLGLTALAGAFHYLRGRWAAQASEAIVGGVRDRLYAHLHHLPCAFHDRSETGDLVQRCTSDVETIRLFLSTQVVEIGRAAILILGVLPVLLRLHTSMALVSLALFPIIIAFALVFFSKVRARFLLMDRAEGAMTAVLQENLTGIRVVRAFARQDFECGKFAGKNALFRDHNYRLIRLLGGYWALSDLLCLAQVGLVLIYGAWLLQRDALSVGTLFAFLTYEGLVIWPVRHLGRVLTDAGKAAVSLGRLQGILGEAEEDRAEPREEEPRALTGEIEARGLGFAFGQGEAVLEDVSFRVSPGQTLALVGPPGSGKSSLVHLLLRLYDHQRGSLRLDGLEISTLSRKLVRSQIGAVLQEPFLYSKTLEENLRIGRSSASREEIEESAGDACIHGSIAAFERGYDTLVGERGVTLSGGQRQRVALARALLKDPPILILDDALSAVDTRTEAEILEALRARRGRRTTIVIAHRLSSIAHADEILVLEQGRVVQSGSHAELVRREGPYQRLWRIQGALDEEIASDLHGAGTRGGEA